MNQIELFKEKSSNSLKAAQNFAIDQDMIYEQNMLYSGFNTQYSQNPNTVPKEILEPDNVYVDFYIKHIKLNEKEGTFDLTMQKDFAFSNKQ